MCSSGSCQVRKLVTNFTTGIAEETVAQFWSMQHSLNSEELRLPKEKFEGTVGLSKINHLQGM